jgi:hypothetical protein
VKDEDYFARSGHILDNLSLEKPINENASVLSFDEAHKIVSQSSEELENCFLRTSDGGWYIACSMDLGAEINGEMFDWWFRNCDDDEKFR